jgi:hypothetical protein
MKTKLHSHRYGQEFLESSDIPNNEFIELKNVIADITEEEIIKEFYSKHLSRGKSISKAINQLIKNKLTDKDWIPEAHIFNPEDPNHPDPTKKAKRFRLDFAKNDIAVEVAFNHGEAISWNLLKPVLSSELNHLDKAKQTKIGIIITATKEMRQKGGFDTAVGTYEKYLRYLIMMNTQLVCPLVIIGLEAPKTFEIQPFKYKGTRATIGLVKQNGKLRIPKNEKDIEKTIKEE